MKLFFLGINGLLVLIMFRAVTEAMDHLRHLVTSSQNGLDEIEKLYGEIIEMRGF